MTRPTITPRTLLSTSLMLAVGAIAFLGCEEAASIAAEAGDEVAMPLSGDGDEHHRPPPPKPCSSEADCDGACPPGSAGCTCAATPHGQACVPSCSADADCPAVPGPPLGCDEGVCRPPPPPEGGQPPTPPQACAADDDCAGACPPESLGCVCRETPGGDGCVPSCSDASDCPAGGPPLDCHEGACVPPPPPTP